MVDPVESALVGSEELGKLEKLGEFLEMQKDVEEEMACFS